MKNSSTLFRHYKNKFYKYLGSALHSETLEEFVVYKPLYETPSELWIRPKAMFFENIIINNTPVKRFEAVTFKYHCLKNPSENDIISLLPMARSIFLELTHEKINSKLTGKKNILLVLALDNDQPIGFKIGFELNNSTYYSWLGGIHNNYRRFGIGDEILKKQHNWCETMGYKFIETKTKNQWKNMILLNIKNGFEIIGTEEMIDPKDLKIKMRKALILSNQ